jgi:hypothetical protein
VDKGGQRKEIIVTENDPAMDRARERAKQLRDFYGHLMTYVVVCSLLVVIDLVANEAGETFMGLNWAYWPIIGWGIAIVIHALSVFSPLSGYEERKAQELYEEERRRQFEHH